MPPSGDVVVVEDLTMDETVLLWITVEFSNVVVVEDLTMDETVLLWITVEFSNVDEFAKSRTGNEISNFVLWILNNTIIAPKRHKINKILMHHPIIFFRKMDLVEEFGWCDSNCCSKMTSSVNSILFLFFVSTISNEFWTFKHNLNAGLTQF